MTRGGKDMEDGENRGETELNEIFGGSNVILKA